jgi:hypothetical protein
MIFSNLLAVYLTYVPNSTWPPAVIRSTMLMIKNVALLVYAKHTVYFLNINRLTHFAPPSYAPYQREHGERERS